MTPSGGSTVQDERTPLLNAQLKRRTPLPKVQIGILSLVHVVTPLSSQSIYPYVNQLVRELDITHGDESRVGYYVGLIESTAFITQACTTFAWSRLSDYTGRKPVMLIGLSGLCISMLCFGLSRTFISLVLSRSIWGLLNGSSGVMKSMLGELTDASNMAQGFAILPILWCVGATVGSFVGGILARPADRWPHVFSQKFWQDYPYFLPCAAVSAFVIFVVLFIALFLKETLPRRIAKAPPSDPLSAPEAPEDPWSSSSVVDAPSPMRTLLVPSILIPIANNGLLGVVDAALAALLPLFYSTPTSSGGLGFSPAMIGTILACFGAFDSLAQILFFAPVVNRIGPKRTFILAVAACVPICALFPLMSWYVARWGVDNVTWAFIVLQLFLQIAKDMAYGCVMMHITSSAPSKRSLGSVNGLSQTASAISRAIGPAVVTSIFSASKQYNLLGGNFVYGFMMMMAFCLMYLGSRLPDEMPNHRS